MILGLEDEAHIAREAISFYHKQFSQERDTTDFSLLEQIPNLVMKRRIGLLSPFWMRKRFSRLCLN